ncbi:hypothetical protein C8R48DRAFT_209546 [Suillus tomentosus]|nr:hypothetical protein C8R48DRAFT_209546 [Suillus tomentosus]
MEVNSGKRKREEEPLPSITYLVGDRSFDRLFKEQSLEEIQTVVRRKLQLPSNSTVKLKQLRGDKVIDLDDDDDFDAFSARARLMKLVDVAVDISQAPPAQGDTSSDSTVAVSKTSETSVAKKKRKANNDQPPKDGNTTVAPEPKTKKRKTDQPPVTKHTEPAPTSTEPAPVNAPAELSLTPSAKSEVLISTKAPLPTDGEPPKKKPKNAKAGMAKDAAEKPPRKTKKTKETEKPTETSSLPISGDDVVPASGPSAPPKKSSGTKKKTKETEKPTETSSLPISGDDAVPASGPSAPPKKSSGTKKIATKSSALQSAGVEKSVNGAVDNAAGSEKKKKGKVKGKEVESEPAPETPAPTKGRKKAAIAGASEAPAPKEKKTRQSKATRAKASDADAGPIVNPINIQDIVNSIARASEELAKQNNTNTEVNSVNTSQPSISLAPPVITTTKGGVSSIPLCHACSGSFHPLYQCPTVLAGQEAIQNRIEELRKAGAKKYQVTIKDLESLLKSPSAADTAKPSRTTIADKESPPSWTPLVPSHSLLSEVTVESRDEGSSSEEEDEIAQEQEQEEHGPDPGQRSLEDVDLDAIMRGPGPIKLRNLIDTLESKEDESDTENEDDDIGPLEVEDDGENERKYRRLSQRWVNSSEEEGDEDDESEQRSISPPIQKVSEPLPSTATPKPSAGPDETSNATDPAGSKKDGVQGAFHTNATRVSVSKVQDSDNDSAKDAGEAPVAADLDKASDTSPARGAALSRNKVDTHDDPIEPADDLMEFQHVISSDNDPIEVITPPTQKTARPPSPAAHSTPKSGIVKRMKDRHGQLLSPSQFPVRADESKVNGSQRAGAEGKKNTATRTGNDKPSIRGGKAATRTDLPRISSQPTKRSTNLNGHGVTPSHSQPLPKPPASLAKWSSLRVPSPSILVEELDSSPIGQGGKLAGKVSDQHSPEEHSDDDSAGKAGGSLFTLPASQVPFPHSQYKASVQKHMEVVSDSESESEAEAGAEKRKTTNAKTRRSIPPYRRLTDIASQATLFSQSNPVAPRAGTIVNGMGGQVDDDDDDDDDDDSSSESDNEGQSHIPQANRAGKLRSKKTKGLLASMVY